MERDERRLVVSGFGWVEVTVGAGRGVERDSLLCASPVNASLASWRRMSTIRVRCWCDVLAQGAWKCRTAWVSYLLSIFVRLCGCLGTPCLPKHKGTFRLRDRHHHKSECTTPRRTLLFLAFWQTLHTARSWTRWFRHCANYQDLVCTIAWGNKHGRGLSKPVV